jgi:hypothetical protein
MKTTIDMAREVYGAHTEWAGAPLERLEQLVALVRADEREAFFTPDEAMIVLEDTDFTWWNGVTQEMVDKLVAIRARGENT